MTIEITEEDTGIRVTFRDDENEVSAVVVGESLSSVKDREQEIVETHDLQSKADDDT